MIPTEINFNDYLKRIDRSVVQYLCVPSDLLLPVYRSRKEFLLPREIVNEHGISIREETYEECRMRIYLESKMPKELFIIRNVY